MYRGFQNKEYAQRTKSSFVICKVPVLKIGSAEGNPAYTEESMAP